jgi:chorismate dehydratase
VQKIKITAISYLNTLPFLYGLQNSEYIQDNATLQLEYPAISAKKMLNGEADVGLVPVAVLPKLKNFSSISDYCIGAENKVNTVALFSQTPLEKINSVFLDYQSMTSVNLVKILAKRHWQISPEWKDSYPDYEKDITGNKAGVIIGDRVFDANGSFPYKFDLAEEWKNFTGLPFVFAIWISNKPLNNEFIEQLNFALKSGIENIPAVINFYKSQIKISETEIFKYYTESIDYNLDTSKKKAIDLFLKYLEK